MTRQPRIALLGALTCLVALVAVWAVAYLAPFGRWLDDATLIGFVDLHSRGIDRLAAGVVRLADPQPFLVAGAALVLRPSDEAGVRTKGSVSAQLFVQDAKGVRELGVEPVAPGAKLRLSLHPGSHERAKAVLIEPGEKTTIYEGAAVSGLLPLAFEWTGSGKATLQITFPDAPAGEMIEFTLRR